MKENKVGELQSLSLQQPTGHWSPRQKKVESCKKKRKKKYKDDLKMARNKLSILQC